MNKYGGLGIDDSNVRRSLEEKSLQHGRGFRRVLWLLMVLLVVSAVVGAVRVILYPGEGSMILGACFGAAGGGLLVSILAHRRRVEVRKSFAVVAREEGRCGRCGYDLRGSKVDCPECGARSSKPSDASA